MQKQLLNSVLKSLVSCDKLRKVT